MATNIPKIENVDNFVKARMTELPLKVNCKIPSGTIPQCKPNITRTCHKLVKTIPKMVGFNAYKPANNQPTKSDSHVEAGPINKIAIGVAINRVNSGVSEPAIDVGTWRLTV